MAAFATCRQLCSHVAAYPASNVGDNRVSAMCAAVRDLPENNAERLNQSRRGSEMIRELTGKELDERRSVVLLQNQNIEELLRQVWSNTVEVDYSVFRPAFRGDAAGAVLSVSSWVAARCGVDPPPRRCCCAARLKMVSWWMISIPALAHSTASAFPVATAFTMKALRTASISPRPSIVLLDNSPGASRLSRFGSVTRGSPARNLHAVVERLHTRHQVWL